MKSYFITGTGTDVGKTFVTGQLIKFLREQGKDVGYYKPALSGAERKGDLLIPGDVMEVKAVAGLEDAPEDMVTYLFQEGVSPHLAARRTGEKVSLEKIVAHMEKRKKAHQALFVEGAGGILCPFLWEGEEKILTEDLIRALNLPVIVVAPAGLGTINHTVLTLAYAKMKKLNPVGVLLNRWTGSFMEEDNGKMIEELSGIPVIGKIPEGGGVLLQRGGELWNNFAL